MKLRCRAGDLALVIHDEPSCKANIGRVVRLEGPAAYSSYYARYCWLIFPVDDRPWLVMRDNGAAKVRIRSSDLIDHPDPWLMPLRTVDGFAGRRARDRKVTKHALKDPCVVALDSSPKIQAIVVCR